jgi:hypothetical protein
MDIVLRFGVAGGAWEGRGWRVGVVVNVDIFEIGDVVLFYGGLYGGGDWVFCGVDESIGRRCVLGGSDVPRRVVTR